MGNFFSRFHRVPGDRRFPNPCYIVADALMGCAATCCPCCLTNGGAVWKARDVTMRRLREFLKYAAHGAVPTEADAQALLWALKRKDEAAFVQRILHVTERSAARVWDPDAEFYSVRVVHDRRDVHPELGGEAAELRGKRINASFAVTNLYRNYHGLHPERLAELPDIIAIRSIDDLKAWAASISVDVDCPPVKRFVPKDNPLAQSSGYPCWIEHLDERKALKEAIGRLPSSKWHIDA